jgi:hypothetical protein
VLIVSSARSSLGHLDNLVAAAQFDRLALGLQLAHPVNQVLLEIILLQVDEGRTLVPSSGSRLKPNTCRSSK